MPINVISVILSAVAAMVIGFLWYGPLFAKAWMAEVKMTMDEMKGGNMGYMVTTVAALVMGTVTSLLVHFLGVTDIVNGAFLGLLVAVGYVGTAFLTTYMFSHKSMRLYMIDAGYQILIITLAAIICTVIR